MKVGEIMTAFTISAYGEDDRCKICRAHMSEPHYYGCELGEVKKDFRTAALIILQFRDALGVSMTVEAFKNITGQERVGNYDN